jgi:hypothetical protein
MLSASVFLLHAVMTQLFVVLPGLLVDGFDFALPGHWKIYLPTMLVSVLLMLPLLARSGARSAEQKLLLPSFCLLALSLACISMSGSLPLLAGILMLYFMAFNLLEATMPALLARYVGQAGRGRRMGVYSSFQFLGARENCRLLPDPRQRWERRRDRAGAVPGRGGRRADGPPHEDHRPVRSIARAA